MDVKQLLKLLKDHKTSFVVIGATAGMAHGYSRLTKDLDIFIEPTKENVQKVFKALEKFGYDLQGTSVEEALKRKLLFREYIFELDIHPFVKGTDFEQIWEKKVLYRFEGEEVYFASLEDLIQMKEAAGRPKDQEDLRHLREIKRQTEKTNKIK